MISALTLLDIAEDKCEAINVEIEEEIQNEGWGPYEDWPSESVSTYHFKRYIFTEPADRTEHCVTS